MAKRLPATSEELSTDIMKLFDAVNDEKDMACVLIASAYIDHALGRLLHDHFIPGSFADKLLEPGGALGAYANRIALCYCLGFITEEERHNLIKIGELRNQFAHHHVAIDFTNGDVLRVCNEIKCPTVTVEVGDGPGLAAVWSTSAPRDKFTRVAIMLTCTLVLKAIENVKAKGEK